MRYVISDGRLSIAISLMSYSIVNIDELVCEAMFTVSATFNIVLLHVAPRRGCVCMFDTYNVRMSVIYILLQGTLYCRLPRASGYMSHCVCVYVCLTCHVCRYVCVCACVGHVCVLNLIVQLYKITVTTNTGTH